MLSFQLYVMPGCRPCETMKERVGQFKIRYPHVRFLPDIDITRGSQPKWVIAAPSVELFQGTNSIKRYSGMTDGNLREMENIMSNSANQIIPNPTAQPMPAGLKIGLGILAVWGISKLINN